MKKKLHSKALAMVESDSNLELFFNSIVDETADLNPVFNGVRKEDSELVKKFKKELNIRIKRFSNEDESFNLTASDLRQIVREVLLDRKQMSQADAKIIQGYIGNDYTKAFPDFAK